MKDFPFKLSNIFDFYIKNYEEKSLNGILKLED